MHAGLGAAESLSKIKQNGRRLEAAISERLTERSVTQAFEKLLGLRSDVDKALVKSAGKASIATPVAKVLPTPAAAATAAPDHERSADLGAAKIDIPPPLDFELCLEQIWEQLIATPPSRGRTMTTVKVEGARILMSSWEVAAFVSEDGPAAEDLRRAVVARALVTTALESAKATGNATALDRALPIARIEVTRLQERVDVAKQAKDTEAAVNLGISGGCYPALDEAEKL